MEPSNPHNLRAPLADPATERFGIRVTMPEGDPMRSLLGDDWHTEHWYATREERDEALAEMGKRHAYYRHRDVPSIRLEPIER